MPALTTLADSSLLPISVERGEGALLYDRDGRAYHDLYGGHAVALLGQAHPRWVAALHEQARTLSFISALAPAPVRDRAVQRLCDFSRMDRAFLVNSGAEANEAALKIARKATGRPVIVAMEHGFHGRTMACLGVTQSGHYRSDHGPVHGEARFVPFGDVEALAAAVDGAVAGVLVEPIQGIAGVIEAPPGYLAACRRICDRHGALLLLDEVQTGIGRTGDAMAWHTEPACTPDIVTVGKSLGAGFPVAAMLCTEAVAATTAPGEHGTTFGGAPLAAAAVLAVIETIEAEGLLAKARQLEEVARARAADLGAVVAVRGRGCLLGLVLDRPIKPIARSLVSRGFLTGTSHDPHCLRLCPPAIMPASAMHAFFDALAAELSS